ncbi:peptide-methionine (R)-S-oxide reductase [Arcanobacterium wilhelmae]|uniref:peptide-methionine (R)-S-oxide reductase n=1 Tax=Arcanobacterium wilhelmae TaxID=1803177 RepID=A0ABT9NAB1_9ACTO|nr:peptide-methionine (R)-S-oxide reductase MsrB [Arcanobacterium wilhelmae]MDP9800662.1 peptide-methionine (R)-S-oxide reductase [Arcanobacterium wilhelmae]WFN90065.1 peptide-methionine (R)-S-oxide reductase MsrB [Arcanobacterium wilhelmae]
MTEKNYPGARSEEEWKAKLTPLEYNILRTAGTEMPGTGALLNEHRSGMYLCKACGAELFTSETKFDSFCGWPSFFDPDEKDAVEYVEDTSLPGRPRTEVRCANCGSHLGHVFPDAPQTPTGLRYCMNSACLTFVAEDGSVSGSEG